MEQLRLPQLCCPFPAAISRYVNEVDAHNMHWVLQFRLAPSQPLFEAYRKSKFAWFAGRIYHNADYIELCLACDFCTWLFLVDDLLEKLGGNKAAHEQIVEEVMHVLEHQECTFFSDHAPLTAALTDLWERLKAISTAAWQRRFIANMRTLFAATFWERKNRAAVRPPSIAEYVKMRPYTSAMYPCIDLIELIHGSWLPDDVRLHETVQQLTLACIEAVCWVNDLVSFNKELRINEPHNLVLLLQEEHHFSPYDAIREVTEVCNETIRHFMFLERRLLQAETIMHPNLPHFIAGLRAWIRGNLDWCVFDTARYDLKLVKRDQDSLTFSKIFLEE